MAALTLMAYKPLDESIYRKYLKIIGWKLEKGSIDHKLLDVQDKFVCTIKISHGKGKKKEIGAFYVDKTKKHFKERGLKWPPKKSRKTLKDSLKGNRKD